MKKQEEGFHWVKVVDTTKSLQTLREGEIIKMDIKDINVDARSLYSIVGKINGKCEDYQLKLDFYDNKTRFSIERTK